MNRHMLVPAIAVLALAVTTTAEAQRGRRDTGRTSIYGTYSEVPRIAYDRGFREGVQEGEKDGRGRDAFRYQDERDYQRADVGYSRSYGDIDRYRLSFRSGFADGYAEGYRRYSRTYGRQDGYGSYGGYGGYGGYPQGGGRYFSPSDIGARDGYEKGREDARKNRSADPRRHKWYREGDREYERRYGNREQYKDEYRRGFMAGYEHGYRDGRYR